MSLNFSDIQLRIQELQSNLVLIDWSGNKNKFTETWNFRLTNNPEVLLRKLTASTKASFALENMAHAERIAQQVSNEFKTINSFKKFENISNNNLHLVVEVKID